MKSLKERLEKRIEKEFKYDDERYTVENASLLVPLVVELANAIEKYSDENCTIIKNDKIEDWIKDVRSNPENFLSGYLYRFGFTDNFARKALQSIEKFLEEN